jgi:hypothetical protein
LSQQVIEPSPALVQSTSVPHVSHLKRFPSWFAILSLRQAQSAGYFFCSIGWPQHVTWPLPPLVTINSDPHLVQMYFLPIWLAID